MYKQLFENKDLQFYIVESSKIFDNYNVIGYMDYLKTPYILVLPKSRFIDEEIKIFSKKFQGKKIRIHTYGAKFYDNETLKDVKHMTNGYPKKLFYKKYPVCLVESMTIGNFRINTKDFDIYREYINDFHKKNILDCYTTWSLKTINIKSIKSIRNLKKSESLTIQLKN